MDLELPTLQAIKSFIALGNGVAFLPEISVKNELARGELVHIPVRELSLQRKLRLIYRKSASLSHAARAFLKVAQSIAVLRQGSYRFERQPKPATRLRRSPAPPSWTSARPSQLNHPRVGRAIVFAAVVRRPPHRSAKAIVAELASSSAS